VRIDEVTLHSGEEATHIVRSGAPFEIRLAYSAAEERDCVFGVLIYRDDGVSVFGTNTKIDAMPVWARRSGRVSFCVDALPLLPGQYELDVAASSPELHAYDYHSKRYSFRVVGEAGEMGTARLAHRWEAS